MKFSSSSPRHEFDYVEEKSCFRAQCNCFCGTGSCRFCCHCCPPVRESTITRVVYIIFLMIAITVMALLMSTDVQYFIMRMLPENVSICKWLGASSSCHAGKLMGYLAVYRIGLAIALYHLILMFSTCGVKTSKDCRAGLHNGFWLYKLMLLLLLCFAVFLIPDHKDYFINIWMYIAMVGGACFIVIQLILLVFMVHKWTDKIQERVHGGGSAVMWFVFLGPGLAIFIYILSGIGIFLLYFYFASEEGCHKNQWFIFINAGAYEKPVGLRLLHASLITLYVTYLTWVAISSAPRQFQRYVRPAYSASSGFQRGSFRTQPRITNSFYQEYYCGPNKDEEMWSDNVIPYLSFVITAISIVYGSLGISESEKCNALELPGCPQQQTEEEKMHHEKEDMGGQMVIRNEKKSLVYSYSLFHAMMALACLLMMMHLTQWHMPTNATLMTFGRSWSSVWITISSSWVCLMVYLVTVLYPSVLPSFNRMNKIQVVPVVEMNGHAYESDSDAISEEAVPLTVIRRPTILTTHQETTV
ncbi:Serine incorporator 3 [Armadillidium nasatum]|uniref:Serine incorporator 3 n=1 Tax=Armadillidium nasatum TaxID=96803 RepID=A0A5N5SXH8_9CRUS|nr:Serine incorporator 3 [Armadillidium nasatum]